MILALAPHTDDVTRSAGGLVAKSASLGERIVLLAFSVGNPDSGSHAAEFADAAQILGVAGTQVFDYETHHFCEHRQRILTTIEAQIAIYRPDLLVIPARHDHQDHQVIHNEAIRAARRTNIKIIAYEQAWDQTLCPFRSTMYASLPFAALATKLRAVAAFESQKGRDYMDPNRIIASALHHGATIGEQFAEAFEVLRWTM